VTSAALPLHERVTLTGPAGDIEARIETPHVAGDASAASDSRAPTPGARKFTAFGVICHPHPLFGGTLDNKVVYSLARAFHDLGVPTIRFNFRGVGKSAGSFADGIGETEDVLAVVAAGREKWPDAVLWLGGFSFGGAVAVRAAAQADPVRLVTVAPAIRRVSLEGVTMPTCPWLIVQGDHDDLVDHREIIEWAAHLPHPPEIALLPGVEHLFHGKLNELRDAVTRFARKN
jgi:alpha/beta superfamily hydrolase